jgi:hypothetical protein
MSKTIEVTQFIRPNGRREILEVELPNDTGAQAEAIIEAGMRFEAEVLMSGEVSLTISGPNDEGEDDDLEIEISPNDERVKEAMNRLIAKGYARATRKGP